MEYCASTGLEPITLHTADGRLIATITSIPHKAIANLPRRAHGPTECASVLEACREVPYHYGIVFIELTPQRQINILNRKPNMNIFDNLHEKKFDRDALAPCLVCPTAATLPDDGLMEYVTVESINDLMRPRKTTTVLMFSEDSQVILKCLIEYADLFECEPTVLSGVPNVTYSGEFESVTWALTRVAYHTMINDLIELAKREQGMEEERRNSSIFEKEEARTTRKTGEKKAFTAFEMPTILKGKPDETMPDDAPSAE